MATSCAGRQAALIILCIIIELSTVFAFTTITATKDTKPTRAFALLQKQQNKNAVDEILDALDTMMGVSPLAETDLKSSSPDWEQAQRRREEQGPPKDALQKPSVAIFFALLGLIPTILSIYAVQHGVRPFGL